jgi:hypothetical protein
MSFETSVTYYFLYTQRKKHQKHQSIVIYINEINQIKTQLNFDLFENSL